MHGSDKTFKMKKLTTYLIVKLGLFKPKERQLPVKPDKDGFWSGILSGPFNVYPVNLIIFRGDFEDEFFFTELHRLSKQMPVSINVIN